MNTIFYSYLFVVDSKWQLSFICFFFPLPFSHVDTHLFFVWLRFSLASIVFMIPCFILYAMILLWISDWLITYDENAFFYFILSWYSVLHLFLSFNRFSSKISAPTDWAAIANIHTRPFAIAQIVKPHKHSDTTTTATRKFNRQESTLLPISLAMRIHIASKCTQN